MHTGLRTHNTHTHTHLLQLLDLERLLRQLALIVLGQLCNHALVRLDQQRVLLVPALVQQLLLLRQLLEPLDLGHDLGLCRGECGKVWRRACEIETRRRMGKGGREGLWEDKKAEGG